MVSYVLWQIYSIHDLSTFLVVSMVYSYTKLHIAYSSVSFTDIYTEMAAKQDLNKNTANNMNCSLCAKLLDILKYKPEGETELKCDKCDDESDPVVAFCIDCTLCLCNDCNKAHSKQNKTHDIVLLDQTSQPSFCPEHPKYTIEHYCKMCDKYSCLYCAMSHHVGDDHDNDVIEKMAYKHRKLLHDIIAPVEEMIENLSKAEANIVSTQEKITEKATEIDQEIDKCYYEQLQELNKRHKQLKEQLNNAVLRKDKALKKQLEEIKSVQDELVGLKEQREDLEKTSDRQVLSKKQQDTENQLKKVSDRHNNLTTLPVESYTMAFNPSKESCVQLGHLCTDLTAEVPLMPKYFIINKKAKLHILSKDGKGQNYPRGGSKVVIELKSSTGEITIGKITDNNDGSYVASLVPEQVGEAKIVVSINGEQIKGSPYSIVVRNYQAIDKSSKVVNNNGSMGQPWGVAFGRNGLWAVVDYSNHCVYIFDDNDQLVRKFGSNGSNNGQFSYPCGVAFDSHNHLYVVDGGNHRVQKFGINGNYLLQFSDGQLDNPYGVTVHNDKVYIADFGNKHISVFQTNGNYKFCISFGSDQLVGPRDVTVSANNHLLVADYRNCNSCIYTYTLDGHYVGKFGTQGSGRGQLDVPFSLTTDLNGFIIVAEYGNHRVSIFDKDHNCIHCFGSNGTDNGQFRYPRGIAVSPNGNIYVSDYDNKRIQIFSNF